MLGVDESTLRRWADSGQVRAFRTLGGHRRFAESDIQDVVAGRDQEKGRYDELGDMTVTRIRRKLQRPPARESTWYSTVNEDSRERLRPLGRQLAALAADYLGRRSRRATMLDHARELGQQYGDELAASGLPLSQAVEAFIFFRRTLGDATKQASQRHGLSAADAMSACEQVLALADEVLVGLTEAYDDRNTSRNGRGSQG
jgi:excisionase family DNA binding protein